jgi:hypothetical protein
MSFAESSVVMWSSRAPACRPQAEAYAALRCSQVATVPVVGGA